MASSHADNIPGGSEARFALGDQLFSKGADMPKQRKSGLRRRQKSFWHLYSLQTLSSEKFIKVVDKILKDEFHLIK